MDRKTALMVGAAGAALWAGSALAAPSAEQERGVLIAASYAELLEPIPNAVEQLRISDAEAAARPARLIPVQMDHHHHHHHHDSSWYRQNGYRWDGGRWILGLAPPPRHHHHHHSRWWYRHNGYDWDGNGWVLRAPPHHHHHHHNNY